MTNRPPMGTTPGARAADRTDVEHELDAQERRLRDMARRLIRLEAALGAIRPLRAFEIVDERQHPRGV